MLAIVTLAATSLLSPSHAECPLGSLLPDSTKLLVSSVDSGVASDVGGAYNAAAACGFVDLTVLGVASEDASEGGGSCFQQESEAAGEDANRPHFVCKKAGPCGERRRYLILYVQGSDELELAKCNLFDSLPAYPIVVVYMYIQYTGRYLYTSNMPFSPSNTLSCNGQMAFVCSHVGENYCYRKKPIFLAVRALYSSFRLSS